MAFRDGNRHQVSLLPSQLEDYVPETDPVRAYDAFVEALELEALGLKLDRNKRGCCEYDPKSMVKLLVYGYSYGVTSSRKLERATHHNLSFIWLMGGLKPNFKTIARFRKQNLGLLKKVLGKSVKMCLKLGLIEGNTLFIDGSKIRGNAGRSKHITLKYAKEQLEGLEKRIEELLEQVEKQDKSEQGLASHQDLQEELKKRGDLFHDMKACIQEMEEEDREKMNRTDKEAVMFKSRQGSHVGYNVQNSVDEKHGLVVSSDVVNEATDRKQLGAQVMEAEQALEQEVKTVCADSGYDNLSEAAPLHERGIELIVPNQEVNESNKKENDFSWRAFKYDQQSDTYRCPTGELLRFNAVCKTTDKKIYRIATQKTCLECEYFGMCTKNKKGRTIKRSKHHEIKVALEKKYLSKAGQVIYKKRGYKVELPFGYLKKNMGFTGFSMRGIKAAKAEMSLLMSGFNIKRMITILGGVAPCIDALQRV